MLTTLDLIIAFAVIMTVLSLLVTVGVQIISAALSLRGKNLANALALTFQSIDPQIGEQAYLLADHILKDPVLSDSLFRPKSRPQVDAPTLLRAVASEQAKIVAAISEVKAALVPAPGTGGDAPVPAPTSHSTTSDAPVVDPALLPGTVSYTDQLLSSAQAALGSIEGRMERAATRVLEAAPAPAGLTARKAPWGFIHWNDLKLFALRNSDSAYHLATAVRPGEVYRLLRDLSVLSDDESKQRGLADLNTRAADLLGVLGVPDGPALEARDKLLAIGQMADLFSTPEQKKAVFDSLDTLGVTVEKAAAQSYDHFQRWFGSAQDRSEQWFQAHTRNVTIVLGLVLAFALQVDTVEVFHQLRDSPGLVQMLVKSAPPVLETGSAVTGPANPVFNQETYDALKHQLDQTGYDLVPDPLLHRWAAQDWGAGVSWWRHFFPHGIGMLITAALLTLGAPFWFNLLKNLMSLRPAVATLVERRPRSAPALPQTPSNPTPPS